IAIVLGIIGTILGAIWVASARVNNNQKVSSGIQEVLAIASGVKALYPSGVIQGGAQNLTPFIINAGNIVPTDKIAPCSGLRWGAGYGGTAGCIVSPWGGQIIVGSQNGWDGLPSSSNAFEILLEATGSHPLSCPAFMGTLVPAAVSDGLVEVYTSLGRTTVSSSTTVSYFANCSSTAGEIALQFQL
ncbi:MAG: hypothetical protein KGI97_07285, partial [Alphaproteobacteria bacterium]|nr:hypothetical protein [Alphaproteobacteria bacterium]